MPVQRIHALMLVVGLALTTAFAWQGAKKPLDHSVYDGWRSIRGSGLSRDGSWLAFGIAPQVGDGVLYIQPAEGGAEHTIPRGIAQRFSHDGKFLICTIVPAKADVDQARKDKKPAKDQPKNALGIFNLTDKKLTTIERVRSWRLATEDAGWVAYQLEEPPTPPKPSAPPPAQGVEAKPPAQGEPPKTGEQPQNKEKQEPKKPEKKKDHAVGSELLLRNLASGEEVKIADVASFDFSENGKTLVYALSTKDGAGDGLFARDMASGKVSTLLSGLGRYLMASISKKTGRVAFLTDRDDYAAEKPSHALYQWLPTFTGAKLLAKEGSAGIPAGWWLSNRGSLRFSDSGARVFFPIVAKPEPEPKDKPADDEEKAEVDVWSWFDPQLMPVQLLRATAEKNRTYEAMAILDSGKITQIESPEFPSVTIGAKGDANYAVINTARAYEVASSWEPGYMDTYVVDLLSGKLTQIRKHEQNGASFSPEAKYLVWFDGVAKAWMARGLRSGNTANISKTIPYPVHDVDDDHPDEPGSQGMGGWLEGDAGVILYDQWDAWLCDPEGVRAPVCVTDGMGRSMGIRLRIINTDADKDAFSPRDSLLLSGFEESTKVSGLLSDRLGAEQRPSKLLWGNYTYTFAGKAKDSDRTLFTRQTFTEYPNVWVSDMSFAKSRQASDANPQQKDYYWGTSELVSWTSLDGIPLQGILIRPENFDPTQKYPMIVYFYERESQNLLRFRSPSPSASTINPTMFASNGYFVFIPDIPYRIGYPGESCVNAVLPGVTSLLNRHYLDPKRIGVQGQSWGGYQVAYLITRTNIFAAAGAGAAVTNMFSAYGGIRWGSGLVRQMQYEHGQSRIGGTPWDMTLRYIENSPLFWADKVETPLLMMNNDKDGAVPWYQGIEFFTALRRLEKPCWMLVYNNEDHNLTQRKNQKDLSVRLQQFFDHYLKGAPAPVWMAEGVPAVKKGTTLGLEIPEKKAAGSGG